MFRWTDAFPIQNESAFWERIIVSIFVPMFEYRTRFKATPEFERLKVILNNHCITPVVPVIPPIPFDDNTLILNLAELDEDVIKLEPNVTDILYPDTFKLRVCSSNKTMLRSKTRV